MHHSTSQRAPVAAAPTGQVNDNDNIKVTWVASADDKSLPPAAAAEPSHQSDDVSW